VGYYSIVNGEIKAADIKALMKALEGRGFTFDDDGWLYDSRGCFTGFRLSSDGTRLEATDEPVKAYGFDTLAQTLRSSEIQPLLQSVYMFREGEEAGDLEGYSYTPGEGWEKYVVYDTWVPAKTAQAFLRWLQAFSGRALKLPFPVLLIYAKDIDEWGVALLGKIVYRVPGDAKPYCPSAREVADNMATLFGLEKAPVLEVPGQDWEKVAKNLEQGETRPIK